MAPAAPRLALPPLVPAMSSPPPPEQSDCRAAPPNASRKRKSADSPGSLADGALSRKTKQSRTETQRAMKDAQADLERVYDRDYEPLHARLQQSLGPEALPQKVTSPRERKYRRYDGPWRAKHLNKIHAAIAELNRMERSMQRPPIFNHAAASMGYVGPNSFPMGTPLHGGHTVMGPSFHGLNTYFAASHNVGPFTPFNFPMLAQGQYITPWSLTASPFSSPMPTPPGHWLPASAPTVAAVPHPAIEDDLPFHSPPENNIPSSSGGISHGDISPVSAGSPHAASTVPVSASYICPLPAHGSQSSIRAGASSSPPQQYPDARPHQSSATVDLTGHDGDDERWAARDDVFASTVELQVSDLRAEQVSETAPQPTPRFTGDSTGMTSADFMSLKETNAPWSALGAFTPADQDPAATSSQPADTSTTDQASADPSQLGDLDWTGTDVWDTQFWDGLLADQPFTGPY